MTVSVSSWIQIPHEVYDFPDGPSGIREILAKDVQNFEAMVGMSIERFANTRVHDCKCCVDSTNDKHRATWVHLNMLLGVL